MSVPTQPTVAVEMFGAIGDGVGDDTGAVQAALNGAAAGATIWLKGGRTYRISGGLTISNRLHLAGPGVLAFYNLTGAGHSSAITVTAQGTRLVGLRISNPSMAIGDTTSGNGVSQYGILIQAHDVLVQGCTVDKFQSGIVVDSHGEWERTRIVGNLVSDILGAGGGPTDITTHNGEDRGDGICVWGSQATITGNIVYARAGNDARIGIHAEALSNQETTVTANADSMVTIANNIIFGQFRRGIVSEDVKRVSITGNSIADSTWWNIAIIGSARDCIVANNTCKWTRLSTDNQGGALNPQRSGIMVYSSNEGLLNTIIAHNTIDVVPTASIYSGIALVGNSGVTPGFIEPIVDGNSIRDESATLQAGVQFRMSSRGAKIINNTVTSFQQYGLYFESPTDLITQGNRLVGPGMAVSGSKAIHFNGSTIGWQINGNQISDAETGINCVNGTEVQVSNNRLARCGTGIQGFGTAAPFVILGNMFASTVTTPMASVTANAVQAGNSN